MNRINALLLISVLLLGPLPLFGQVSDGSDIKYAISSVRSGRTSIAAGLLAGESGALTGKETQQLVDSLVTIATSVTEGAPPSQYNAAAAARTALLLAGTSKRGIPFPHAFESLVRVFEGCLDPGGKAGTLWLMTQLPDVGQVVGFLAQVAQSNDASLARTALRHLAEDTGSPGMARLRKLFEENEVVEPSAKGFLQAIASAQGWGSPGHRLEDC